MRRLVAHEEPDPGAGPEDQRVVRAPVDEPGRRRLRPQGRPTSGERAELVRLRRENRVQAMEIEILKRASAYCQADIIDQHTLDITGGLIYAELDREDPNRATAIDSAFLQASPFTSVVASVSPPWRLS
jgi:hypothetical protein